MRRQGLSARSLSRSATRGPCLARETADGLELVDGHLRVQQAEEGSELPVLVLDVSPQEADLLLATLDPIGGMAKTAGEALAELLAGLTISSDELAAELARLAEGDGWSGSGEVDPNAVPSRPEKATTVLGDFWILGNHRLLCADATEEASWEPGGGGRGSDGRDRPALWSGLPAGSEPGGAGRPPSAPRRGACRRLEGSRSLGRALSAHKEPARARRSWPKHPGPRPADTSTVGAGLHHNLSSRA